MVNPLGLRLGLGKPEFAYVELHSSLMCTPDVVLPFLRGVERRAPEHSCHPQQPSNHSGNIPQHIPAHSDPQTHVSVAEYNYLVR